MNHPPKRLALLISLIGGGISPYAMARIDEQRVDLAQTLPGIACTELEAVALPACGPTGDRAGERDLVWQPQRSALDLSGSQGVLVLYGAPGEDWAPGEAHGAASAATSTAIAATTTIALAEAPRPATVRKPAGKTRRVRVLAPVLNALPAPMASRAKLDASGLQRIARIEQLRLVPAASAPIAASATAFATASTNAPPSAGSIEVERLLANLAMVLGAAPAPADVAEAAPPADTTAASEPPDTPRTRAASAAKIERPAVAVAVETQANLVLRQLGAILSDERDEVGAAQRENPHTVVTTQSDKVMAMLGQISAAEPPVVEDGPAKRLRKLATRAAKAQAQAAAAAAESGVDVLLPLELHTFAALPAASFATLPLLSVQQAPVAVVEKVSDKNRDKAGARSAGPFGDRQVAVSESSLDRVRGGFAGEGLNISFGIERAVYINGSLVTTTSLNVVDLGQISAGRAGVALDSGTIALIQNGAGNLVAGGSISSASMGTIVQNTLDGQKIQNVTTINATANSLGVFRTLNLQSSLRGAVIDSLRR